MDNSGAQDQEHREPSNTSAVGGPLRGLSTNQDVRISQYLNRRMDESNLSSDSDDTYGIELDGQPIRFPTVDESQLQPQPSSSFAHPDNVFSYNNFPNDWNEGSENQEQEEPLPWNLEQLSVPELKRLATEMFQQVSDKSSSYPEQIAQNTTFDLSHILEEFKRNFAGLIDLVNTDEVDDDANDAILEQIGEMEEKKNVLFQRFLTLQQKKNRCAQMISRFRGAATLTTPEQVMAKRGEEEGDDDDYEEAEKSSSS